MKPESELSKSNLLSPKCKRMNVTSLVFGKLWSMLKRCIIIIEMYLTIIVINSPIIYLLLQNLGDLGMSALFFRLRSVLLALLCSWCCFNCRRTNRNEWGNFRNSSSKRRTEIRSSKKNLFQFVETRSQITISQSNSKVKGHIRKDVKWVPIIVKFTKLEFIIASSILDYEKNF